MLVEAGEKIEGGRISIHERLQEAGRVRRREIEHVSKKIICISIKPK